MISLESEEPSIELRLPVDPDVVKTVLATPFETRGLPVAVELPTQPHVPKAKFVKEFEVPLRLDTVFKLSPEVGVIDPIGNVCVTELVEETALS